MSTIFNISNKIKLSSITPLLLDLYPGSAAAYSLRSLSSVTNNVVRVREDAGNTEQDFTAAEVADGTLEAFVGAGNNGYVVTWYDQSGNGNDATQGAAAEQPKIVDAGVLVEENGKPALQFDGSNDGFTTSVVGSPVFDFYSVIKANINDEFILPDNFSVLSNYYGYIARIDSSTTIYNNYGTPNLYVNGSLETPIIRQDVVNLLSTGNQTLNVHQGADTSAWSYIEMFKRNSFEFQGVCQEVIIYDTDQSSNRVSIENNINNHYNIY
jgi:hypothetical protein